MTAQLSAPAAAPPRAARRRPSKRRKLAFALPAAVFLLVFSFYPLAQLLRMSVSDVTTRTLNQAWEFVGGDNFAASAAQGSLWPALGNTFVFVLVVTGIGLVGGLGAAILLSTNTKLSAFVLGLMVFIWALPPVVNGSVWKFLLGDHGLINSVIMGLGLSPQAVPFLYDDRFALLSVAIVNSWAVIPFNALVFRAAILGIPGDVFEAARIDGANRWQEIWHMIVPAVRPTTLVLIVLTVVYAFRSFDFIFVMTYGGPGIATNTLPFLSYLQAFVRFDFGMGSATAVISVLMVLVLAVIYARSVRSEEAK
ncbi:multiple sugar transport system permease protein [Paramicrobacterium humi]|uniref:Multiple sugar transport system permease protein n=1 Tax=Paramicrobacterium humi TaxID=640635 RepID=A0A1H4KN49_9MICO|nr:sugar ABC transporter permease [Microbacterium humi]SEB59911.1 multiple sugar transport system permease protein [Microbacterium humi]